MSGTQRRNVSRSILVCVAFVLGAAVPILLGAGGKVTGPNATAPERYAYYPGTEELPADES